MLIANKFLNGIPGREVPEHTENYEGFFHLVRMEGRVDHTEMEFIIRDFDRNRFEERKSFLNDLASQMNREYGDTVVEITMKDQYFNMKEMIDPQYHIVELAKKAMITCGIKPKIVPVRGGTDGSRLSYMGLPCPNIFGGGHNFHGIYEFIPTRSMEKACQVIVAIASGAVEMYG